METPTEPSPKPRRWRSISLRGMLLLVFVVGGVLGWWARQAHLQRAAVAMIESANGSVVYNHEVFKRLPGGGQDALTPEGNKRQSEQRSKKSPVPPPQIPPSTGSVQTGPTQVFLSWASRNLGIDFVDHVVQVVAIGARPGEPFDPARLADLTHLERLNLQLKSIGDRDLVHLSGLRRLRALCLANNRITDAGLVHLEQLDLLEDLILTRNGDGITDAGLARLKSLKRLQVLEIGSSKITDAGLEHLRELPALKALLLRDSPNVTPEGLARLRQALPGLKTPGR